MSATLKVVKQPPRPGPGPMPDGVLRALDITVGRRVAGLLQGDYRSSSLGHGTELAQIRRYEPGDDVRQIDWNVTARYQEPHVRIQVAERVLTTWLLLDTSPSMWYGTADRLKADVAEGVAMAIGHVATRHGNSLGVMTFGDASPLTVPPSQGRKGMMALMQALRAGSSAGEGATSLGSALGRVSRLGGWSRLITVVSDFRGPRDWRLPLVELAGRHDVVCIEIRDQREMELPDVGELFMVDPETGRQVRVDTSSKKLRERFAAAALAERAEVAAMISATGTRHVMLSTRGDWLKAMVAAFGRKGARR